MVRLASAACAAVALAALPSVLANEFSVVKKRQGSGLTANPSASTVNGPAGAATPATSFTGSLPASVLSIVTTISSGVQSTFPTYTLPTTATPGQTNSYISGAPPLPTASTLNPANYPTLDKPPPTNSPEVQQWLSQINLSGIPSAPVNPVGVSCSNSTNPNFINRGTGGVCWWTCGGCTRDTDITTCPDKNTWGVSYDDGPSPYTPLLLDYFETNQIKSTFFIVGSRAISRPQMLQTEFVSGHQLSVHTWSHTALTEQTNEEIVAELGWTKKIIKDVTGLTPNTMRPPYGDIDDRVRYLCAQMGLTPIIWTTAGGMTYDTNDWKIGSGLVSAANSAYAFEQIIRNAPNINTGYIVLSHDLYQQSVELSIEVILPFVKQFNPTQTLKPIISCLGKSLSNAYIETSDNKTSNAATVSGVNITPTSTGKSSSSSSSSSGSASMMAFARPAHAVLLGGVCLVAAGLVAF